MGCPLNEQALDKLSFLKLAPPESYEALVASSTPRRYTEGEVICQQGKMGEAFYIVAGGRVQVIMEIEDGSKILLASLEEGDFFGEISLIRHQPHVASVVAETRSTDILSVDKGRFDLLLGENPQLSEYFERVIRAREEENRILRFLAKVPLFVDVPRKDMKRVLSSATIAAFPRGSIIFREGDLGDAFYVVIRGKVRIWMAGDKEKEKVLAHLYPGDFFGEMALFSQEPRSASTSAEEETELLVFTRESFGKLIEQYPRLLLYFNKILSKRLSYTLHQQYKPEIPSLISVYSSSPGSGKTTLAAHLGMNLLDQTQDSVVLLDLHEGGDGIPSALGIKRPQRKPPTVPKEGFSEEFVRSAARSHASGVECMPFFRELVTKITSDRKALAYFLTHLRKMYRFVVVELPSDRTPLTLDMLKLSDAILHLMHQDHSQLPVTPGGQQRILKISSPVGGERFRFDEIGRTSFNMPDDGAAARALWESGRSCLAEYPARPLSRFIPRIVRCLLDRRVGFALGGGAAWGMSHIGVLSFLEKNGIPIDLIAGTSMGSVVGSIYAARGLSGLDEMVAHMTSWPKLLSLLDLSFFTSGIIEGTNVQTWLRSIIGDVDLEALEIPCWVVAADFDTSEEVTLRRGHVVEAVRCSVSIPGIFTPYTHQGHLLVDGGTVNCVPVTTVKEMGADKVIAVNVVPLPSREDADLMRRFDLPGKDLLSSSAAPAKRGQHLDSLSSVLGSTTRGLYSLVRGFNVLERFNHMIRSLYMLMYDASERQSHLADVIITPDVAGYSWIEFNKCMEFMELGEQAAEGVLPAIKGILQER